MSTAQLRAIHIGVVHSASKKPTKAKKSKTLSFMEIDYYYADNTSSHEDVAFKPRK